MKTRLRREAAPRELHARIRASLTAADRLSSWARVRRSLRWAALPALALVLLALAFALRAVIAPSLLPVVSELVSQHQVYSRVDTPAEIVSADQDAVAGWLQRRVRFEVPVPDFSPAGIRLVGARLSSLSDREVAYLLYEKGGRRVSLFAFAGRGIPLRGMDRSGRLSLLCHHGHRARGGALGSGRVGLRPGFPAEPRMRSDDLAARRHPWPSWRLITAQRILLACASDRC